MKQILAYLTLVVLACSCLGFQTIVVKHRAAGTISLTAKFSKFCAAATTTCSVTGSSFVGSGTTNHYATICATAQTAVQIGSISVGGTFREGTANLLQTGSWAYIFCGYVAPTSATAGPIVVNFVNNSPGDVYVDIRESSVTTGTLALDAVNGASNTSATTPYTSSTPTLSGANDLLVNAVYAGNKNTTSVAAPWADSSVPTGSSNIKNPGFADHVNTTSNAAPVWTLGAGGTGVEDAGIALGVSPAACSNVAVMDESGGTATNGPLTADLNASTFGATGIGTGADNAQWGVTNASTAITYQSIANKPLLTSYRQCFGGATYTDSSSLSLQYNTTIGGGRHVNFKMLGSANKDPHEVVSNVTAMGFWFATTLAQTDSANMDFATINTAGDFVNAILFGTGAVIRIQCEVQGGLSCPGTATISTSAAGCSTDWNSCTRYWLTLGRDTSGNVQISVYDSSVTLITNMSHAVQASANSVNNFNAGESSGSTPTTGRVINISSIKLCYIGTGCAFPLLP